MSSIFTEVLIGEREEKIENAALTTALAFYKMEVGNLGNICPIEILLMLTTVLGMNRSAKKLI